MGGFFGVFPGYYNDKVGWYADGALNLCENDPRAHRARAEAGAERLYEKAPPVLRVGLWFL